MSVGAVTRVCASVYVRARGACARVTARVDTLTTVCAVCLFVCIVVGIQVRLHNFVTHGCESRDYVGAGEALRAYTAF